jgi:multidrug efflux pump subunit AcrA (membrane-fusion protein)
MNRAVHNRKDTKALWLIITVVGLFLITSCNGNRSVDEVEFLVPVSVSDVGTADVEDLIVATGTLRASRMVSLEVETGGVLEFAKNKEGRRFGEGDRGQPSTI